MNTQPPVSSDYERITQDLKEMAEQGKRPPVPYCQTLLENIESYAILLKEAQEHIDAMEPLLLEVLVHLRQQPHFNKQTRLSLIHRAERALMYDTHDARSTEPPDPAG